MFPAQAVNPPGQPSDPTWDLDDVDWSFSNTSDNVMQIVVQLPHRWLEHSVIRPHLHLKTKGTSSAKKVTWEMKWRRAQAASGTYSDWTTSTVVYDVPEAAGVSCLCPLGDIDMSGYKVSSMMDFQITRKTGGGTDLAAAIVWKQFDIHIQIDSSGSSQEYIK